MNRKRLNAVLLCVALILQMGSTALAISNDSETYDAPFEAYEEVNVEGLNAYDESLLPDDFFTSTEKAAGVKTEREPNNTMASATVTYSDYDNRGTIQTQGDVDYWKITLSKGHVNFWIETPTNGQYYQYEVLNSSGTLLGKTSNTNKLVKFSLPAGTYYVKIYTTSNYANSSMQYLFRCKLYPYTAIIMQGNTMKESDCLAAYNGLTDGGYEDIVTYGWKYTDKTHSTILEQRVTESQFITAKDYDVAYFSGHGGSASSKPAINVNATYTYGKYNVIKVAEALGVSGDSWKSTAVWKPSDKIRVLMLAACSQLTDTNAKYYARIMRASGIRAIAGYYGTGPGHETDTRIAEGFFEKAAAGTSVYGAWKDANNAQGSHPWAVLVYNENSNQYYRLPGYPGNTYTTPTTTAKVYLYSAKNTSGGSVLSSVSVDDLPLAFSLNTVPQLASDADISREPVYADEPLMDMADDAIFELSEAAGGADAHTLPIRESAVLRQEIDEDGDIISGSDIIVERGYTMYDVYRGVKVADSFVTVSYDSDGVNSVINRWKDIYNEYAVEIITHDADQYTNRISEDEALSIVEDYALSMQENELFEVYSTDLAYALADENLYELAYEVDTSSGVYYVSIQTGNVL